MKVFRKLLKNFGSENTYNSPKSVVGRGSRQHESQCENSVNRQNSNLEQNVKTSKLHSAILDDREADVRKYLNKHNINELDFSKRTPLHLAIIQNNLNIVRILLSHGASVEIYDNDGLTPFLKAVEVGNIDLVKLFLERKLNEKQTDFNGNTALHFAVKYGFYKIIELLVQNSNIINVANNFGDYPLHIATQNESFSIVRLLIDYNASIDVEDGQKRTPLLIAVKIANLSLVELFLRHGADRNHKDLSGTSVQQYALKSENTAIKMLLSNDDHVIKVEAKNKVLSDEDSQTSEQSFTLPPKLGTPKSWNILHPDEKENKFRLYRRNVRSLSPTNEPFSLEVSNSVRSNSLSTFKAYQNTNEHEKEFLKHDIQNLKLENCQKVLDKLSLDVLHSVRTLSDNISENVSSDNEKNYSHFDQSTPNSFPSNIFSNQSNPEHDSPSTLRCNTDQKEKDMKKLELKGNENDSSSSSDEDPPFWKNSTDGGYFTEQTSDEKNKKLISGYVSSSSDEDEDMENYQDSNNIILNRLKQVTRDNQDLETESAVLKEAAEKLKFDLANSRLIAESKETDLEQLKTQMIHLDNKYLRAVEKINSFQLGMNNLEQEIEYLRKSYKTNQRTMPEIKECQQSHLVEKCESNERSIRKLEADVLYWKSKYEEIAVKPEEKQNQWGNFGVKNLLTLNFELNNLNNKVKDCLSKADVAELQNQQQMMVGKMMQQILDEAEQKLQTAVLEIRREMLHQNELIPSDVNLRFMEYENMNHKLTLEVSKLSALIKEKEINEQRLKNQLNNVKDEVQKLRSEKHKILIKKAFDDCSLLNDVQSEFHEVCYESSPDYASG